MVNTILWISLWIFIGFIIGILYVHYKQNNRRERILYEEIMSATTVENGKKVTDQFSVESECVVVKKIGKKILIKSKDVYLNNTEYNTPSWIDKIQTRIDGWYTLDDERLTTDVPIRKKKIKEFLKEIN